MRFIRNPQFAPSALSAAVRRPIALAGLTPWRRIQVNILVEVPQGNAVKDGPAVPAVAAEGPGLDPANHAAGQGGARGAPAGAWEGGPQAPGRGGEPDPLAIPRGIEEQV